MKHTKKLILALLALLAAVVTMGCKVETDTETVYVRVTKIAVFFGCTDVSNLPEASGADCILQMTMNFYNDKSYEVIGNVVAKGDATVAVQEWTQEVGTYTGNPNLDGTISLTTKYEYNETTKKLASVNPSTETVTITNGKITDTDTDTGLSITMARQ